MTDIYSRSVVPAGLEACSAVIVGEGAPGQMVLVWFSAAPGIDTVMLLSKMSTVLYKLRM